MVEAVLHILQHPAVIVNEKTKHGSSPLMVAVKYGEKAVVEVMIKDTRTDLGVVDASGRSLYEVIGVAADMIQDSLKLEISELIKTENNKRSLRKKKKGVHKGIVQPFCFVFFKLSFSVGSWSTYCETG